MQETYTPNDATEEIAVQEEEEIPQDQDSPPNEYLMHISIHELKLVEILPIRLVTYPDLFRRNPTLLLGGERLFFSFFGAKVP